MAQLRAHVRGQAPRRPGAARVQGPVPLHGVVLLGLQPGGAPPQHRPLLHAGRLQEPTPQLHTGKLQTQCQACLSLFPMIQPRLLEPPI